MRRMWYAIGCACVLLCTPAQGASVGTDGGITLHITFSGDLDTDMVSDDSGVPIINPDTGAQWQAQDKLEHDLRLFAQHIYQMTEHKHYLRNVLVIDNDRSSGNADIQWTNETGDSESPGNGWHNIGSRIMIRRGFRTNIHEVVSHEMGHYFYGLADEYLTDPLNPGYFQGQFAGTGTFTVTITGDCVNTIMNRNNPYQLCDGNDHSLTVDYTHPTSGNTVTGEVLTPALIDDGTPGNEGPISGQTNELFALDGWAVAASNQTDLIGHHTDGVRLPFNAAGMPPLIIEYVDPVGVAPGRILLLDRSGSMAHVSFGIPASQYVQEAGLFLYHSSEPDDYIGAFVYNENVEPLFAYDQYDDNNNLVTFFDPDSLTNIHDALQEALDALVAEHGADHVAGGEIFLMSDGRQTTGNDLWLQVDRAKDLGVAIHTFSYGDADASVMDQIASDTNGDDFLMSESTDNLMNLKMRIIRSLSKMRGFTPVYDYYGPLKRTGVDGNDIEYQTISFDVPEHSKDLKFYLLPEQRTRGKAKLTMKHDVSGFQVKNVHSAISDRGRFEGCGTKSPRSGKWIVTIRGDRQVTHLPRGNVQLIAMVKNPEIDARVWMDQSVMSIGDRDRKKVYATVANVYPLTKVATRVHFTDPAGRKIADIQMNDEGKDGDTRAADGIYTGQVNMDLLTEISKTLRYNLKAVFRVTKASVPAPNAGYEPGTDYRSLLRSYVPDVLLATAEEGISLTQRAVRPTVKLLRPPSAKVSRVGLRSFKVGISNAFPDPRSLRVNLGKDIALTSIRGDRSKGEYTIRYVTPGRRGIGPRDIYLQFGNNRLKLENIVIAPDGRIGPAGGSLSP